MANQRDDGKRRARRRERRDGRRRLKNDEAQAGYWSVGQVDMRVVVALGKADVRQPVRTLADMSKAERAELERLYGVKISKPKR